MKKLRSIILIFSFIALCCITSQVFATSEEDSTYENLKYKVIDNEVTITGYTGEPTDVNIPTKIEEYPVTSIADGAFYNCTSLKNITFSNILKKIGSRAFEECTGLTNIAIPENVTEFGYNVFIWCSNISNVKLPNNLKTIPDGFLEGCTNLKNITIPYGVTKIGGGAFSNTGLVDVVIPNSVKEIWYGAFDSCGNLRTVTIPSSVTFLGDDGNGDGIFFWDSEEMPPLWERVTLYVEKGSYAEQYAQKHNIKYVVINDEKENPKSPLTLKESGIILETTTDVIPSNTSLIVKNITNGNDYDVIKTSLNSISNKFIAYDITLMSDNKAIQPNGKVKLSIPIPDDFDTSKLVVYRIEENGTKVEYAVNVVTIDNMKYAQFETDHFSNYVLAEKTLEDIDSKEEQGEQEQREQQEHILDNEPKTGYNNLLEIGMILLVATICFSIVIKKYKK